MDEAVICPGCGCAVEGAPVAEEDKVSVGLCILAFFVPIFGIIYWPVTHRRSPKRARACGITAIVGWVVSLLLSTIASTALAALMSNLGYL